MASVRFVTTWGVALRRARIAAALLATALLTTASLAGCSDDDGVAATTTTTDRPTTTSPTTTTAPERPASTTTTAYDPAAVEGQVEAAYLRSWDVYAEAVYHLELDEQALAEVYAEDLLAARQSEIARRIDDGRAAHVRVDHDYTVQFTDADTAVIIDQYLNHQVLIDPVTKWPTEDDPNELLTDAFTLRRLEGEWRVVNQERLG